MNDELAFRAAARECIWPASMKSWAASDRDEPPETARWLTKHSNETARTGRRQVAISAARLGSRGRDRLSCTAPGGALRVRRRFPALRRHAKALLVGAELRLEALPVDVDAASR